MANRPPNANTVPGYTKLPDGPNIMKPENLVKYFRKNPGWVYKHRDYVFAAHPKLAGLAGYVKTKNGSLIQYEGGSANARGRMLNTWFPKGVPNASEKAASILANSPAPGTSKPNVFVAGKPVAKKGGSGLLGPKGGKPVKPGPKPTSPPPGVTGPVDGTVVGAAPSGSAGLDLGNLINIGGLAALDPNVGGIIPLSLSKRGAKLYDADAVARAQAGMQFDPAIHSLGVEQKRAPRDEKQNIRDIESWYGQVLGAQAKAAQRDAEIGKAGVSSIKDATQAIISSLGGAANEGAGLVGAAGAEQLGTLGAISASQDMYNSDLAPLLKAEGAAAKTREQAAGSARAADLAMRMEQLLGQRGQAQAAAKFGVDQANNAILDQRLQTELGIRSANNAVNQARFGNAFGIEQAKIAAAVSGGQLAENIIDAATGEKPKSKHVLYSKAPQTLRDDAYNSLVEGLSGRAITREQALNFGRHMLNAGYGWSLKNPAVANMLRQAMKEAGIE